jgi:superfamily II DNA or RNA helicase
MVNKFCPVLYNYITDEAVLDNILNDYKIIIHMLPLDGRKNIKMQSKAGKTWMASELDNYRYWSDRVMSTQGKSQQIASVMRMKKMQEFKSKELYAKTLFDAIEDKCILFANTQEQADRLCEHSYHSNNPDSEGNLDLFGNDHITKLSCVLQLSEGVNIPNLRAGVIMHAYGNERKSSQRIGRLLRLNPNDVATVHILCYQNTVDEKWITDALSVYDDNKITYIKDNKIFIRESN